MKKVEVGALTLSIAINIALLFILPEMKVEDAGEKKIQVGLVALEKKKKAAVKPKPTPPPAPKKSAPEPKPVKPLESVAKTIEAPKLDPRALVASSPRFQQSSPRVSQEKELQIKGQQERKEQEFKIDTENVTVESIDISKNSDSEKKIDRMEMTSEVVFDRILNEKLEVEGLPSGYRIGVEDGDMMAQWENGNQEPVYPELAQLRGQQGTVSLRLSLDERGNVTGVSFEKGSGIPEINSAIEEIARTWKIYLSKNGLGTKGNVILEYNFKLQGRN